MKFSLDLRDWEAVHFRGFGGVVLARLAADKKAVTIELDPKRSARARNSCAITLAGASMQLPDLSQGFSELSILRIPDFRSGSRPVVLMDCTLNRMTKDAAIWLVKAPDKLGSLDLVAECDGKVVAASSVLVKKRPARSVPLALEGTFFELQAAGRTAVTVGDAVGVRVSPDLLTGKLRWYVR